MLHAISRKKSRRHKAYHYNHCEKVRAEGERRVSEEDEITSIIFGPLSLLRAEDSYEFWKACLCRDEKCKNKGPEDSPVSVSVEFWPKLKGVEPDLFFEYKFNNDRYLNILVELKWRSPLSGENQLKKQWEEFLTDDDRKNTIHVLIGPDISVGISAMEATTVDHQEKLFLWSWPWLCNHVLSELSKDTNITDGLRNWSGLIKSFIEAVGIKQFVGFGGLKIETSDTDIQLFRFRFNWHSPVVKGRKLKLFTIEGV